MKEYIERETYSKVLKDLISDCDNGTNYERGYVQGLATANGILLDESQTSTADVVEVRHGEWTEHISEGCIADFDEDLDCFYKYYRCSICNGFSSMEKPYCPNCGAKMGISKTETTTDDDRKQTNFDRIRNMSVEELAEFLDDMQTDALFLEGTIHDLRYPTDWKEHLESEVEGE